jgi:membrane-bound metal-dependent hydrolase YbcI (DUF457 family)
MKYTLTGTGVAVFLVAALVCFVLGMSEQGWFFAFAAVGLHVLGFFLMSRGKEPRLSFGGRTR